VVKGSTILLCFFPIFFSCCRFRKIHTEPLEVEVEGSTVSLSDNEYEIKFLLSDIEFSPLTCRGLKLSPFGELNFTMQIDSATWKTIKPQKFDCKQSCQEELIEKVQLYQDKCFCTKCGYKIITNHRYVITCNICLQQITVEVMVFNATFNNIYTMTNWRVSLSKICHEWPNNAAHEWVTTLFGHEL